MNERAADSPGLISVVVFRQHGRSDMLRILFERAFGLLCMVFLATSAIAGQAAPDTTVYAVSYVDVMPASRGAAAAALKQYRDSSRSDDGHVRIELFEQMGRPGHFAILETWRDQKALDAHGMAAHAKQLQGALQPIRSSGYDQRPYKTVIAGSAPAAPAGQTIFVVTHVDTVPNPQNDPPGLLRRLAEASRSEKVMSRSTCSSIRCAPITSRSSRPGRIRARSTRTPRRRIRGSTATRCNRCPAARSTSGDKAVE